MWNPIEILLTLSFLSFLAYLLLRIAGNSGVSVVHTTSSSLSSYKNYITPSTSICELIAVFTLALSLRVAALAVGLIFIFRCCVDGDILSHFAQWDGRHYINLSNIGYSAQENGQHISLVFFPLYPWIVRAVTFITGNTIVAGMTVSTLCYCLGCCQMYRLVKEDYSKKIAIGALVYLSVFPFAFFFGLVMSESLFFFLTISALYEIRHHRWARAGIIGAFSALTRMHGILIVIPAICELFEYYKPFKSRSSDTWNTLYKKLPLTLLPSLGTSAYLLLNYYIDKNPFAFLIHQNHWHQGSMWFSNVLARIIENIFMSYGDASLWQIWLPQLVLFILFSALLVWSSIKGEHRNMYLIYALVYFIMNYSLSWLLSAGRYLSCGIVFFIFLSERTVKRTILSLAIVVLMLVLFGIYFRANLTGDLVM